MKFPCSLRSLRFKLSFHSLQHLPAMIVCRERDEQNAAVKNL